MKNILYVILLISPLCFAQTQKYDLDGVEYNNTPPNYSLFQYDLASDTSENHIGPNKKLFGYSTIGLGSTVGVAEGDMKSKIIPSSNFNLGSLGRIRINNVLAIGTGFQYDRTAYLLDQNSSKVFPDSTEYDKQKLAFHSLQIAPFIRINFDWLLGRKRGNFLGDYIDIGAYGGYSFGIRQVVKFEDETTNEKFRVVKRGMEYLDRLNYGWMARLGFNHFAFYGTYRLSNWVDQDKYSFAFPRITVGMQLAIFEN